MRKAKADFRDAAVQESLLLLGDAAPEDPFDSEFSYCLPSTESHTSIAAKILLGLPLVLGYSALIASTVLVKIDPAKLPKGFMDRWYIQDGFVPLLVSATIVFIAHFLPYVLIRYGLSVDKSKATNTPTDLRECLVFSIDLEDANTFDKLKITVDDSGLLLLDSSDRVALITGKNYRYLILREDVQEITTTEALWVSAAVVKYRIGEEVLSLAIIAKGSGLQKIKELLIGFRSSPLYENLVKTLGTDEPQSHFTSKNP